MKRGRRTQGFAAISVLSTVVLAAAACGGSSTTGKSGGGSTINGWQGVNPGSGSPHKGGTLNMLGQGDVDYMDPNISYYTIGALAQRMWVRGLYAYPAIP